MTIAEKLAIIKNSINTIKQAIIDKGGDVSGDISTWGNSINNVETGPKEIITNKLYNKLYLESFTHTYEFNSEILNTYIICFDTYRQNAFTITDYKNVPIALSSYSSGDPIVKYNISNSGTLSFSLNYSYPIDITITLNNNLLSVDITCEVSPSYTNMSDDVKVYFCAVDIDNNFDYDLINLPNSVPCILKDSLITLSNNTQKLIQDITYDDELLVWNFDECRYDNAKPLWIKKVQRNNWYYKLIFSDGNILKVTGTYPNAHRLFNYTDLRFDYANECVGKQIYTNNGIVTLESCEYIEEVVEHYNIITNYHMNLFVNNILTSCRYNNLYIIENMKFVKDNRDYINISNYNESIPEKYFLGLRLQENLNSIEENIEYINRLIKYEQRN